MVGAAATSDDREIRPEPAETPVLLGQLVWIALVELLGLVQLGVGLRRRIRPEPANSLEPAVGEHVLEVP
jgi:hypothetical protein